NPATPAVSEPAPAIIVELISDIVRLSPLHGFDDNLRMSCAIVFPASGRDMDCAREDMICRCDSLVSNDTTVCAVSFAPLVIRAAPASTIRLAFTNSAPGMGSKKTVGKAHSAASAMVRPPGLVTKTDAEC